MEQHKYLFIEQHKKSQVFLLFEKCILTLLTSYISQILKYTYTHLSIFLIIKRTSGTNGVFSFSIGLKCVK